jgi:hypothetical protein
MLVLLDLGLPDGGHSVMQRHVVHPSSVSLWGGELVSRCSRSWGTTFGGGPQALWSRPRTLTRPCRRWRALGHAEPLTFRAPGGRLPETSGGGRAAFSGGGCDSTPVLICRCAARTFATGTPHSTLVLLTRRFRARSREWLLRAQTPGASSLRSLGCALSSHSQLLVLCATPSQQDSKLRVASCKLPSKYVATWKCYRQWSRWPTALPLPGFRRVGSSNLQWSRKLSQRPTALPLLGLRQAPQT